MNKNEIYLAIGYKGKYDNSVKKKLKKLMKEYHPDINKKDNKTIKILLEVKKELETNNVKYKPVIKKEKKETEYNTNNINVNEKKINNIIEIIKIKINKVKDELLSLYKSINYQYKVYDNLLRESNKLDLDIDVLKSDQVNLNKISNLELINIFIILIMTLILFIKFNILIFLIIILLLILQFLLYYYRNLKLKSVNDKLIDYLVKKDKLQKDIEKRNNNILSKEKEIMKLKQDIRNFNNDIAFYTNELSKNNNKTLNKNKNNSYSKKKL